MNGTRYYYRLEDVDTSSKVTSHGPVSAVPMAGLASGRRGARPRQQRKKKGAAAPSCPDWVVTAYGSMAGGSVVFGCAHVHAPRRSRGGVARRRLARLAPGDARAEDRRLLRAARELRARCASSSRASTSRRTRRPRRCPSAGRWWTRSSAAVPSSAGCGRSSRWASRASCPTSLGKAEMQVSRDGTVRAGRRALPESSPQHVSMDLARLLPSVFQGETKSAVVELDAAALRRTAPADRAFEAAAGAAAVHGPRDGGERTGQLRAEGRSRRSRSTGELLARLYTTGRGLYAVSFDQLFPGRAAGLRGVAAAARAAGSGAGLPRRARPELFGPGSVLYFHADTTASSTDFSSETAWELAARAGRRPDAARLGRPLRATRSRPPPRGRPRSRPIASTSRGCSRRRTCGCGKALASGATRAKSFSLAGSGRGRLPGGDARRLPAGGLGVREPRRPPRERVAERHARSGEAQFAGKKPYRMSLSVPPSHPARGGERAVAHERGGHGRVVARVPGPLHGLLPAGLVARERGVRRDVGRERHGDASRATAGRGAARRDGVASGFASRGVLAHRVPGGGRLAALPGGSGTPLPRRLAAGAPRAACRGSRLRPPCAASTNQADYLLIAPRAFLAAAEPLLQRRQRPGPRDPRRRLRGDHGRVRARPAFRRGDPELPRLRLPVLGPAVSALRAAARRLELRPAELHRHVAALAAAGAVDEDELSLDRLGSRARCGQRRRRAARPRDRTAAGDDRRAGRRRSSRSCSPGRTRARASSGQAALVADNPDLAGDFEADVRDIAQSYLAGRSQAAAAERARRRDAARRSWTP